MTDELTASSLSSTRRPKTLDMQNTEGRLMQALDNLWLSAPPEPFAGRFHMLNERVSGGQALVQVRVARAAATQVRSLLAGSSRAAQ